MTARRTTAACLLLAALAFASFAPALHNGFVDIDDATYVTANPHVQRGVTGSTLVWAATTTRAANWHPLTWISHACDWALFGGNPWGHHLTSVALHAANAVLLFLVLAWATGDAGPSLFVAALFAVHPLHVESVAWVAERKDVLSTLFWFLATGAYVAYARAPSARRMAVVAAAMAAGLAAKPMLVTLPFTLLLLDVWPLGRRDAGWGRLVLEKLPLFALAAASSAITLAAQRAGGAMASLAGRPLDLRIGNAVVSAAWYLRATIWPRDLAVFYPYPAHGVGTATVLVSAAALAAISVVAVTLRKTRPYLAVGWAFYLGTLVPVIGLVAVGNQARADRYTYVPLIGIFVMLAWGARDVADGLGGKRLARRLALPAAAVIAALAVATWAQVKVWHDSVSLFEHDIAVAGTSATAEVDLGAGYEARGDVARARACYEAALALEPDNRAANNRLAGLLVKEGKVDEAIARYRRALAGNPGDAETLSNLGIALGRAGRLDDAIAALTRALAADGGETPAIRTNLGNALLLAGRTDEAIGRYREALVLDPRDGETEKDLGIALHRAGRDVEAREALRAAEALGVKLPPPLKGLAGR